MPKQNGFNLYALKVYYKDGTTNICYARKTDDWFYFNDAMDFRIKLDADNTTITEQEWRRKHYSSSWYESGLLDHVVLMEFGEEYLQSELNPMRDNITENGKDIVNNYNTFVNYRDEMWNVFTNIDGTHIIDQIQYNVSYRRLWYQITRFPDLLYTSTSDFVTKFVNNFNSLVEKLQKMFGAVLINDAYYNFDTNAPHKTIINTITFAYGVDENGLILPYSIPTIDIIEGERRLIGSDNNTYETYKNLTEHIENEITRFNSVTSRYNNLESRYGSLESRIQSLESRA